MTDSYWQQPQQKSNTGLIVLICLVGLLLLGLLGFGAYYLMSDDSGDSSEAPALTVQKSEEGSTGSAGSGTISKSSKSTVTKTTDATETKNPKKEYKSFEPGSSVTSQSFAQAVYDAFRTEYDGDPNITLHDVHSSVTGKSYTMRCSEEGSKVVCRGGNNAVVKIH
ncbi:hypothetical protein CJ203_09720 [Corynebacterium tuscaniense]|uniref:Uncharacterized protein n=1 Tax=Corynebacterium tuscaniense TaxID=302449 RepID=A0A2N6T320_9CORY|nr:hypothetical protein [Corynebacterium tuscaniense]PMC63716.1 hypothetical protein CJ203_09720 [Corynebacterium tuscaniense]